MLKKSNAPSNAPSHSRQAIQAALLRCRTNDEQRIRRLRQILRAGTAAAAVVTMAPPSVDATPRMAKPFCRIVTVPAKHPKAEALEFENIPPEVIRNYVSRKPNHDAIRPKPPTKLIDPKLK